MKADPIAPLGPEITAQIVLQAVAEAVDQALLAHKRAGNPMADWQDGKVVLTKSEEIKTAAE